MEISRKEEMFFRALMAVTVLYFGTHVVVALVKGAL